MKIVGTKSGNYILIIAKPDLFIEALSEIEKSYDNNIVRGILDFLGFDETASIENIIRRISGVTKPIFFLKSLYQPTRKSDILYTEIIERAMSEIRCNSDYTNDDYVVIAPCSLSGSYISHNFASL